MKNNSYVERVNMSIQKGDLIEIILKNGNIEDYINTGEFYHLTTNNKILTFTNSFRIVYNNDCIELNYDDVRGKYVQYLTECIDAILMSSKNDEYVDKSKDIVDYILYDLTFSSKDGTILDGKRFILESISIEYIKDFRVSILADLLDIYINNLNPSDFEKMIATKEELKLILNKGDIYESQNR